MISQLLSQFVWLCVGSLRAFSRRRPIPATAVCAAIWSLGMGCGVAVGRVDLPSSDGGYSEAGSADAGNTQSGSKAPVADSGAESDDDFPDDDAGVALSPSTDGGQPYQPNTAKSLSGGWSESTLGPTKRNGPTLAGSIVFGPAAGAATVTGYGDGIFIKRPSEAPDSLYFAYKSLTGDGEITARVASVSSQTYQVQAGVMVRPDLNGYGVTYALRADGYGTVSRHFRLSFSVGEGLGDSNRTAAEAVFVKITRRGNVLQGFSSVDGARWQAHDPVTATGLPATLHFGVYVGSGWRRPREATQAVFDSIAFVQGQ
jgi:hypothetical protein